MLDVGTGDGTLLDALKARGRDATGLEREASRPDMHSRGLGGIDGKWVGDHLLALARAQSKPGQELERATALLEPGDVLVIAVPNAASVQAKVFGERWLALDIPRHLTHIPANALNEKLRQLVLEVERVNYGDAMIVARGDDPDRAKHTEHVEGEVGEAGA